MKIAIVGAGKLGTWIAETLLGGDHSITIIDKNEALLSRLGSYFDIMTVAGNGKQIELLDSIDIDTYDYLIATTDRDEKNIVIASIAKKMGCSKVIARVRDPEHMNQIDFIKDAFGIDYITNPDLAITQEIYKYLVEKYTLKGGIFTTGRISLLEFSIDKLPNSIGMTLEEVQALIGNVHIVAVSRNGKIILPCPNTTAQEEDTIYVVGEKNLIAKFSEKVKEKEEYTDLQKVMIAGGGKTGFYLATMLSEFGAAVKIIEKDKARCHKLAAALNNVLILNGDATDIDLLEDEGLEDMDAFVSATGFDEENLLLALMAKQEGVEDVIAKISRENYADLTERMGVDMVLNPVDLSASYVLRFMQGNAKILASEMIQGQAELIELLVDEDMFLTDKPISKLHLPEGVKIAAIDRKDTIILPDDDTVIEDGDRIMVMTLLSEVDDLEKLIKTRKLSLF